MSFFNVVVWFLVNKYKQTRLTRRKGRIPKKKQKYIKVRPESKRHKHFPMLWRINPNRRVMSHGWADYEYKFCQVNIFEVFDMCIEEKVSYEGFIIYILEIYFHEFMHLFFHFRLEKWAGHEKTKVKPIGVKISDIYLEDPDNFNIWFNMFKDCLEYFN